MILSIDWQHKIICWKGNRSSNIYTFRSHILKCFLVSGVAKDKQSVQIHDDGGRVLNGNGCMQFYSIPFYATSFKSRERSAQYIFRCVGLHYLRYGRIRR